MDSLFSYSLTVSVTLAILWVSYRIALSSLKNFTVNRAVLLFMLIASLTVYPLPSMMGSIVTTAASTVEHEPVPFPFDLSQIDRISSLVSVMAVVWAIGAGAMLLLTLIEHIRLLPVLINSRRVKSGTRSVFVTDDLSVTPFSIGKIIVINSRDYSTEGDMILCHESGHLRFCHTVDMMLTQIVTILCWYNPVVWLFRQDIQSIHEYQADAYTLSSGYDSRAYQLFLIGRASGTSFHGPGNRLNHGKLRKRIEMMKKGNDNRTLDMLRYLVPVGALFMAIVFVNNPTVKAAVAVTSHANMLLEDIEEQNEALDVHTIDLEENGGKPRTNNKEELPVIFVDGQKTSRNKLNDIPANKIRSITIDKRSDQMDIELKNE